MRFPNKKTASVQLGATLLLCAIGWSVGLHASVPRDRGMLDADARSLDTSNGQIAAQNVAAGLGIVEPASGIINLSALMPGVIARVLKSEGDTVTLGDVLVELVNDDLKAQLAQAQSNVRIEAARLAIIENGPRPEEIKQAESKVREQESSIRLFEKQLQRRQVLAGTGAVARETLNEAERMLAVSQQQLFAAQKQLDLLRQGSRPEELEVARATFRLAQDQLAEAEATLDKSYVRATTNGVVLRRYLEPGEAVSMQPGSVIMQIADTSRLVVRTQVDENDISGLRVGQKAYLSAASLNGQKLVGTVARISPRVGAKTVTAETPNEKRDTRVLDVMVALEPGISVPIYLRVDVIIDLDSAPEELAIQGILDAPLRLAERHDNCLDPGCVGVVPELDIGLVGAIRP